MAQKDKVKELVGRGLHSYHTKALQQMDRIEKKNKEQNHKISILSNELDNDYLTKTEEGSVVSLEHSKEGMVYLDELQGNTLVNYCTDGSKEMTLNGDIDLEGTFVTTTEGVDGGKIDVMCEGNTLINLWDDEKSFTIIKDYTNHNLSVKSIKPNTTYTLILRCDANVSGAINLKDANNNYSNLTSIGNVSNLNTPIKFTTLNEGDFSNVKFRLYSSIQNVNVYSALLLEGDWTNKEIPQYFEGMKSVGQDDANDHKIEILSQNKNLFNYEEYYKYFPSTKTSDKTILSHKGDLKGGNHNYGFHSPMKVNLKPNATYTLCVFNLSDSGQVLKCEGCLSSKSAELSLTVPIGEIGYKVFTTNSTNYKEGISFKINTSIDGENAKYKIMLVEGDIRPNDYIHYNQDKKEILLNEPLRGLSNGVKDRFVKIGGKLFIERNFHQMILDGSENWQVAVGGETDNIQTYSFLPTLKTKDNYSVRSDKFINRLGFQTNEEGIYGHANGMMFLSINKSKAIDVNTLVQWLSKNNIHVVYQMQTPIYEPLEINPELICYNDTTHISNNSLIPCNMKVKNSGYNAIIKPSTLYTIALDTNKSGTIGMNLSGVKVTTTNNVTTITTPATLTDDSLRLYGKGIKGSKVRLLEGDKTNWIPSHFEGMKSSFEDKFDTTDNTYKMEILSNNKNLFNGTWVYDERNNKINSRDLIKVKPNTTYTISDNLNYRYQIYEYSDKSTHFNSMYPYAGSYTFTTNKRTHYLRFSTYAPSTDVDVKFILEEGRNITLYEPNKSNKIQFSSIEPLRGVDDVKDRFVFKDNKLMIERNCGIGSLDGTASIYHCWTNNRNDIVSGYIYYNEHKPEITNIKQYSNVVCTDLPNNRGGHISTEEGFRNTAYFAFSIHKSKLGIEDINAGEANQNIVKRYFTEHPLNFVYQLEEPIYEEIPYELQKIILEGYENGTLFFDTNIPPTSTITYAGETPIVKSVKLNKTEVLNNTNDINDNIIPYLMDMDYRVVCLQLQSEEFNDGVSMTRLFGGAYEMLQRDIQSNRYSVDEYRHRLDAYLGANKITEDEYNKLGDMLNE